MRKVIISIGVLIFVLTGCGNKAPELVINSSEVEMNYSSELSSEEVLNNIDYQVIDDTTIGSEINVGISNYDKLDLEAQDEVYSLDVEATDGEGKSTIETTNLVLNYPPTVTVSNASFTKPLNELSELELLTAIDPVVQDDNTEESLIDVEVKDYDNNFLGIEGAYPVTVVATDEAGLTSEATATVTILLEEEEAGNQYMAYLANKLEEAGYTRNVLRFGDASYVSDTEMLLVNYSTMSMTYSYRGDVEDVSCTYLYGESEYDNSCVIDNEYSDKKKYTSYDDLLKYLKTPLQVYGDSSDENISSELLSAFLEFVKYMENR